MIWCQMLQAAAREMSQSMVTLQPVFISMTMDLIELKNVKMSMVCAPFQNHLGTPGPPWNQAIPISMVCDASWGHVDIWFWTASKDQSMGPWSFCSKSLWWWPLSVSPARATQDSPVLQKSYSCGHEYLGACTAISYKSVDQAQAASGMKSVFLVLLQPGSQSMSMAPVTTDDNADIFGRKMAQTPNRRTAPPIHTWDSFSPPLPWVWESWFCPSPEKIWPRGLDQQTQLTPRHTAKVWYLYNLTSTPSMILQSVWETDPTES